MGFGYDRSYTVCVNRIGTTSLLEKTDNTHFFPWNHKFFGESLIIKTVLEESNLA